MFLLHLNGVVIVDIILAYTIFGGFGTFYIACECRIIGYSFDWILALLVTAWDGY
jgi:hypothetical protein